MSSSARSEDGSPPSCVASQTSMPAIPYTTPGRPTSRRHPQSLPLRSPSLGLHGLHHDRRLNPEVPVTAQPQHDIWMASLPLDATPPLHRPGPVEAGKVLQEERAILVAASTISNLRPPQQIKQLSHPRGWIFLRVSTFSLKHPRSRLYSISSNCLNVNHVPN